MKSIVATSLLLTLVASAAPAPQPLKLKSASASSQMAKYPASNAIDGTVSDDSRWVSEKSTAPAWLVVNLGKPKRFTAPTLADGTAFIVRPAEGGDPLFKGILKNHIGDFSALDPQGDAEYVVEAGAISSVPFRIGPFWLERVTYQNAVDFMIDSRHYVGNDRNVCGGSFGWRDDHHLTSSPPQIHHHRAKPAHS